MFEGDKENIENADLMYGKVLCNSFYVHQVRWNYKNSKNPHKTMQMPHH